MRFGRVNPAYSWALTDQVRVPHVWKMSLVSPLRWLATITVILLAGLGALALGWFGAAAFAYLLVVGFSIAAIAVERSRPGPWIDGRAQPNDSAETHR